MISISRKRAENRFAAIEESQKKALSEQEELALKVSEKTARLKTLRLVKEAAVSIASRAPKPDTKKASPARKPRKSSTAR